jgi:hypothetical protein
MEPQMRLLCVCSVKLDKEHTLFTDQPKHSDLSEYVVYDIPQLCNLHVHMQSRFICFTKYDVSFLLYCTLLLENASWSVLYLRLVHKVELLLAYPVLSLSLKNCVNPEQALVSVVFRMNLWYTKHLEWRFS